jgi:hypothetical protein
MNNYCSVFSHNAIFWWPDNREEDIPCWVGRELVTGRSQRKLNKLFRTATFLNEQKRDHYDHCSKHLKQRGICINYKTDHHCGHLQGQVLYKASQNNTKILDESRVA